MSIIIGIMRLTAQICIAGEAGDLESRALTKLAEGLVKALDDRDVGAYVNLFATEEGYIQWRRPSVPYSHELDRIYFVRAQRSWVDDYYYLTSPISTSVGRMTTLRFHQVRIVGEYSTGVVRLAIDAGMGGINGDREWQIASGDVAKTKHGWRFVERLRNPDANEWDTPFEQQPPSTVGRVTSSATKEPGIVPLGIDIAQDMAQTLVKALVDGDHAAYAAQFVSKEEYCNWIRDHYGGKLRRSPEHRYAEAKKMFCDDMYELLNQGSTPRGDRLGWTCNGVRLLQSDLPGGYAMEIAINVNVDGVTTSVFIVTGAAVSTATGWRFIERLRDPLTFLPARVR